MRGDRDRDIVPSLAAVLICIGVVWWLGAAALVASFRLALGLAPGTVRPPNMTSLVASPWLPWMLVVALVVREPARRPVAAVSWLLLCVAGGFLLGDAVERGATLSTQWPVPANITVQAVDVKPHPDVKTGVLAETLTGHHDFRLIGRSTASSPSMT